MRPWFLAPVAALLLVPAAAPAQVQAPDDRTETVPARTTGGAQYGAASLRRLRVGAFSVTPGTVHAGESVTVRLRIDGAPRKARMRVDLVPSGARKAAARLKLGVRPTRTLIVRRWRLRGLEPGRYTARVHAMDKRRRKLQRTAKASGKLPVTVEVAPAPPPAPAPAAGPFPIQGPWTWGGDGSRFGAKRSGHIHQGQDLSAPEGTPLITPIAGTVFWRAVQKGGAGHYVVIRGVDGRDYVYMHLVAGSIPVAKGDPVAAGQQIGQVGSTGASSGPHLHFEIWPDGWYAKGSEPIDPRPQLEAWAAGAAPS